MQIKQEQVRRLGDWLVQFSAPLVAAGAVAIFAMWRQVAAQETRITAIEVRMAGMESKLEQVSNDTSYIRGRLEPRLPGQ